MSFLPLDNRSVVFTVSGKAKRLKEAKAEAQAEIEAERAEREHHFKICEELHVSACLVMQFGDFLNICLIRVQRLDVRIEDSDLVVG
ncbi:unnamed protein product [Schistosoma mattheei]|uniref:Uncharacterized protein n=1 Tax=Schistosoma mattheei TaxID=31246 RepID=A0A183PTQ3_9TREM|nr:unnamed protein product [Schistosoma mattheei]